MTTDLWSDSNLTTFMAVTLHWISRTAQGELKLMTALGGFRHVKKKHSGSNIADRLFEVLQELNILHKIGRITLDNAKNNNTAMQELQTRLTKLGIRFIPEQQRIRCISHVIHLAVEAAIEALPNPHLFDPTVIEDPFLQALWHEGQKDTMYSAALKTDLIGRIQHLIHVLRASGQRREFLQQIIISGNRDGSWEEPIPRLQLLRRVAT